ncbi:hypothetical protein EC2730350_2706 [Escherichia coli 2730350]|nr:hypothetical protein EC2730350_2706 [Escherichia coli 2730350]
MLLCYSDRCQRPAVAPQERDPQLKDKITRELAVIVRHLMQKFSDPIVFLTVLAAVPVFHAGVLPVRPV